MKIFIIKREFEYIEFSTKKKKKVLQFPSKFSNFELLHDSSLWVFIAIVDSYDHFILLSLSSFFIFMQLLLSICLCFYKNILN